MPHQWSEPYPLRMFTLQEPMVVTGADDHYATPPQLQLLTVEPGVRAEAVWHGAAFPGHFSPNQYYAVAAVFAAFAELKHQLVGCFPYEILHTSFQARRLVPAHVPTRIAAVQLGAAPKRLPGSDLQGVISAKLSLVEADAPEDTKPAIVATSNLRLAGSSDGL